MQFSIVVPVYNVEKYLPECLKSIENQVFQDYEVILVDDGSTDQSGQICDRYAKDHPNTIVIHKKNDGLLMARRTGIHAAKGDYILHCDSDDYISRELLRKVYTAIEKTCSDMVMFGYNIVDNQGNELEDHYHTFENGTDFNRNNRETLLFELSTTAWLNNMVTKATKRECVALDNTDYSVNKSLKMGEDLFQVIPLVNNCRTFTYIAEPLYHYRRNSEGMSKAMKIEYLDNYLTISNSVFNMLKQSNVSEKTMMHYYNRYMLDVNKYLLRLLKMGISPKDFDKKYQEVIHHEIYTKATNENKHLSKTNKLLSCVVKPQTRMLGKLAGKTVFSKRLELR